MPYKFVMKALKTQADMICKELKQITLRHKGCSHPWYRSNILITPWSHAACRGPVQCCPSRAHMAHGCFVLPPSSPSSSSASPTSTLVPLLETSALLSARSTWEAAHALACHLHKGRKVHLTRIHALCHHFLHHHLHLLFVHATRAHANTATAATAAASSRSSGRRNAWSTVSWRSCAHGWHTRHGPPAHHGLHLCHVILLPLQCIGHGNLTLPVQLPCKFIEAVVEVIRLVLTWPAPDLLLLGQIRINIH